ncbi:MAG TPA: hypothetical protein VKQ70_08580 [Caulobacteraceae bacterium]|jgi:cytoskeletal protein RodZ|nr:hypothetical protein [Caulobacteraceae bacterium]
MRPALLIAAGFVAAMSGQAFAASQPATSNMPPTDAPMQSTTPRSQTSSSPTTAPPATSAAPSTSGSASDTSATAGAAAAAQLSVGQPVKDNTGATIGAISSINTSASGQQMAVIKMGNDTFQVPGDRLGVANGAATINLSQAQISGMIHPAAGGK